MARAQAPSSAPSPPDDTTSHAPTTTPDFDTLYEDHVSFVYRNLFRLGVPAERVEDATQEVFLVVHRRLPGYRPDHSPRAWLFAILRRVAADHRRHLRRKGGLRPLPETVEDPGGSDPQRQAVRREAVRVVHAFIDTLPEDRREVFVMSELEQMTAPEVAEALGMPTQRVYTLVRASRDAMRSYVRTHHPELAEARDD